jgi:hypothetical protein
MLRTLGILAVAAALAIAWATGTKMASAPVQAGVAVPVIVELFTSEGCSSCPAADRLLTDLVTNQPVAGAAIIGLSEHVDYWDRLGWKDPFSDGFFTRRQIAYGSRTSTTEVYTPQMIVDGGSGFVGSDRAAALLAIRRAASVPRTPVSASWAGGQDVLSVRVEAGQAWAGALVLMAITEDGLESRVERGENAGHVLAHTAVARHIGEIGRTDRAGSFHREIRSAPDRGWRRTSLHLVVFLQDGANGPILGASTVSFRQ